MDRTLVSRYILSDSAEERGEIIEALVKEIKDDNLKLIDVVQGLGEYLTKEESGPRVEATEMLTSVLGEMPGDKMNKQQITVIATFLSDRLDDEECLKQVAGGILSVIKMRAFSVTNIEMVLRAVKDVNMRKHSQNVRYEVFCILAELLAKFKGYIKSNLKDEFTKAYVEIATNEKDPRNLLVSFDLSHVILSEFENIEEYGEDLFDVTFCYYPITFEPKKNDPYGISSAQLKSALRKSIAANGELFAKEGYPALIEKLNSSSASVKQDAFDTIVACIDNYSVESTSAQWVEIWDGVKYEVLHGSDDEGMSDNALVVIERLGAKIPLAKQDKLLEAVLKETREKLDDPASKYAVPAAKLCGAVAKASERLFSDVASEVLPREFGQLAATPTIAEQRGILTILTVFLDAARENSRGLADFKDEYLDAFSRSLRSSNKDEVTLRLVSMRGLAKMVIYLPDIVADDEIGLVVQYFDDVVLEDDNDELVSAALSTLVKMAAEKRILPSITDITLPAFFDALTSDHGKPTGFVLSALAALAVSQTELFNIVCDNLSRRLINASSSKSNLETASTLVAIVQRHDNTKDITSLLEPLVGSVVEATISNPYLETDDDVIDAIGVFTNTVVQACDEPSQTEWYAKATSLLSSLITTSPTPLANLYLYAVAAVPPPSGVIVSFATQLVAVIADSRSPFVRSGYLRLLTLVINKWFAKDASSEVVEHLLAEPDSLHILEAQAYVAKALVMKNEPIAYDKLCSKFVMLLQSPQFGAAASKLIAIPIFDDPVLNKQNKLTVRLLYKQRYFSFVLPHIIDGFRASSHENYLSALAAILRYMPSKIILPELDKFLPLLFESITVPNVHVQQAAIDTLLATVVDADAILAEYLDTVIPKLLKAATQGDAAGVKVAALNCLSVLPNALPVAKLQPFRADVIKQLRRALDDRKRDVRKAAADCSQNFYEM
ncbi:DNA repair/transcription protein Met18p/MMS19 [Trichomonascus vanleenenianus]|uniref:Met18p n=1 Tax=Trichomonascus vanleenenianus TaxID=2268995 RepID=UPI003ECA1018